jgi:DNA polymerase-1
VRRRAGPEPVPVFGGQVIYGFDTETHLISPGCLAPKLVCGTVACETFAQLLDRQQTIEWYREKISLPFAHIVGVRLSYDLGVLCAEDQTLIKPTFRALFDGRLHCCAIREALIDIGRGALSNEHDDEAGARYSLALLAQRYLGIDISGDKEGPDAWRLRYNELDGIPPERWPWPAIRYPLRDAVFPWQIYQIQEGGPNLHDEIRQMRADFALHLMAMWGLRTNKARVDAMLAEAEAEWLAARDELGEGPGKPGIFRSDEKRTKNMRVVQELVVAAYQGSPPTTLTGKPATDRDTLVESGNSVLRRLGTVGKNDKRISQYGPLLRKGESVPWNQNVNTIVATGRCSGDGQQLPTGDRSKGGIRECFEPRPDHGYSSNDYPGLELFTMSERAIVDTGQSVMAEFLISGKDCHSHVAAQFMGKTYEEVVENKKTAPYKNFRNLGKIFNFGKGGGMGAGAMAYNAREKDSIRFCLTTGAAAVCGLEKEQIRVRGKDKPICSQCLSIAKKLGYDWLEAWPEQKELARLAGLATETGDALVTVPYSNRVRGGCRYTQWLNTPFQGLGGDLAKDALWNVSFECYVDTGSPLYGSRVVMFVHDEIICEHPLDRISEAAERVATLMDEAAQRWLPNVGKAVKVEPAISLTMSKAMATKRDPVTKKLILWTP